MATETLKYKTIGTHCPSCTMLIQMDVTELDGVECVEADHTSETVTVVADTGKVSADDIAEAIRGAGYGAERVG